MSAGREDDSPLQRGMRAALNLEAPPRPRDPALQKRLRELIEELLGEDVREVIRSLDSSQPLWVDRVPLSDVLACERYYLAERGVPFAYTVQKARTQAAGAMLRRWAFRDPRESPESERDPIEAVHELLDDLSKEQDRLGAFISGLSTGARADMAAAILDIVFAFGESWPSDARPQPIQSSAVLRVKLYGGRLVLNYRVGFRFGRPRADANGIVSSVVLLDVRPGVAFEREERHNRWFAALLETLKTGVGPARVLTWYAETQQIVGDEIDDDKLEAAARRVAEGVTRMVELGTGQREADVLPGWRCSFCDLLDECSQGQGFRATWNA